MCVSVFGRGREGKRMGMADEQRRPVLHILAVPFQQEGHINSMVRLAQYLAAQEDVVVTLGYPARFFHLALKHNKLPALTEAASAAAVSLRIRAVEDGLPREEEQSLTIPLMLSTIPIFQNSVKLLLDDLFLEAGKPPIFGRPAHNRSPNQGGVKKPGLPPPSCFITDTFMPWSQDFANSAGIPRVEFWPSTAAVYAMGSQLTSLISNAILPLPKSCWVDPNSKWTVRAPLIDGVPGLAPFPPTDLPRDYIVGEDVKDPQLQFMVAALSRMREAHTILIYSLYYLERQVFDALKATGLPVYAIGPINAPIDEPPTTPPKHPCLLWLDSQAPSSVIYIALGTIAKLSPSELHALALGLEASHVPFLWVVRLDAIAGPVAEALPPGFLERTAHQGIIIPWAPQTQVLSHASVGAFFSHCGWNSTIESMWEGVPMVACPRAAEQRSNTRWIVEHWKIGVELEREDDGSFTQQAVERAVREVLKDSSCTDYKERALHAKDVARRAFEQGGTSRTNIESFLDNLRASLTVEYT